MRPTVKVDELLAKVQANKDRHRIVFEAALEGWKAEVGKQAALMAARAEAGSRKTAYIRLICPADHTSDYDRVIEMLTLHQGTTIELSETDVAQYLMDEWGWSREWKTTNSGYAAATVSEYYGSEDGAEDW